MKATEVRVVIAREGDLRAFATVTFDESFAVRNMKIVEVRGKLMLCMPSRKVADGTFKDIAHPVNRPFRTYLEDLVLGEYRKAVERAQAQGGAPAAQT